MLSTPMLTTAFVLWLFHLVLLLDPASSWSTRATTKHPATHRYHHRVSFTSLAATDSSSTPTTNEANIDVPRLFIGGLGYCGMRIAARFRRSFSSCHISGCVRSASRRDQLLQDPLVHALNISIHVLDLDDQYVGLTGDGLADLWQASHVVQTIAPIADFDRDPILALHGKELLHTNVNWEWVGYLSSTGVYGNHDGAWVDESTSELRCTDAKSLARISAEREWRELEHRLQEARQQQQQSADVHDKKSTSNKPIRVDCFRCGGIYGPGRSPLFSASAFLMPSEEVDEETSTSAEPPKYVNRIIVDDLCEALFLAATTKTKTNASAGGVYNLVDDDPAPRRDVMAEARRLRMGTNNSENNVATPTTTIKRRPSTRNTGNKRCRNDRIQQEFGWRPMAPTYKEGLAYLLAQEQDGTAEQLQQNKT